MHEDYVQRADLIHIPPSAFLEDFSEPERLLVRLTRSVKKKGLDFGSFAYADTRADLNVHEDRGEYVVLSSFVESRRELILAIIQSLFTLREESVLQNFVRIRLFIRWLNREGFVRLFESEEEAQRAYVGYTAHLIHRLHTGGLKPRTAAHYQEGACSVIKAAFPQTYRHVVSGVTKISGVTQPVAPSDDHIHFYRDVCLALARQCSEFVLNKRPFPCVVNIRDYEVVVFHSVVGVSSPYRPPIDVYNAAERRIATLDEYKAKLLEKNIEVKDRILKHGIMDAQKTLSRNNRDERSRQRLRIASLAVKAYACLLLLITGATPTEFSQFLYADALQVNKSPLKKELSAVKFRAGGKVTNYNVGRKNGLSILQDYLKLREWLLDGRSYDKLFFTVSELRNPSYKELDALRDFPTSDALQTFYRTLHAGFIDPSIPILTVREMRRHKSVTQHMGGFSVSTVANSLNHTETMNLGRYSGGTLEHQKSELSKYWEAVQTAAASIKEQSEKADQLIPIASGQCEQFGAASPAPQFASSISILPDCQTQHGCLFCVHYVCHSDETDINKLMSLQYVVNAVRRSAPDMEHAELLYSDLSARIDYILNALAERGDSVAKIVEKVRTTVHVYGVLTPFWETRLSRFERLGAVF